MLLRQLSAVVMITICRCAAFDQTPQLFHDPEGVGTARSRAGYSPDFKLNLRMVLVPVTVTDSLERPITDLREGSFRIFEDNIEQKMLSFHREDGPVSVGFVVDTSTSMARLIDRSIAAIQQLLKGSMPGDEFFLIQFSDRPALVTGFTPDPDRIISALRVVPVEGATALNDAVYLGVHEMRKARNARKALLVLSDGGNNNSRYSSSEVRSLVQESDVQIYSIGLFGRRTFLEKLGSDSGGKAFSVHTLDEFPKVIEQLSRELKSEYVLGYTPSERAKTGAYRRIRVEVVGGVNGMPVKAQWRRGYYN